MTDQATTYRWTRDEFVRAFDAGAFENRVELIEGEVWPVSIGPWHGAATVRVARALPEGADAEITSATLPAGESLPDPDCWVCRAGANPAATIGRRLVAWDPADVLLVVEVSDETTLIDLTVKPRLYASAGYTVYWVVTADVVYEHTDPTPDGYRVRTEYRRGERIPVVYARTELAVDDLLGA